MKGFWMAKGTEGDPPFDNPSRIDPKRSRHWFIDAAEPELFPNKKQALLTPNSTSSSQISNANVPTWDNPSGFQSVPNQFMHRLFGPETARSVNFGTDDNASVSLSMSHTMEDPEACLGYNGFRKVKVNQVKDCDNGMHELKGHGFINESNSENNFISMGQAYDKEDGNVTLMGHGYDRDAHNVATCHTYIKEDDNAIPITDAYSKEDANMISFGGFPDAQDIIPVGRPGSGYDQYQSSVQAPEAVHEKELDASNADAAAAAAASNTRVAKAKLESVPRNKPEVKTTRKEAPNSFPSNVRSLISTGMLDGVPVKYVSLSREELRGVIKGSGYLCSCQSCNFSKVLNAYEFERHAGCKTKHPNNHIYFENGKTIYQIVQELRSTPESMLFDVIQTVFGAPINQKSFRMWKESFQAATRELQRIYGKEELNL
ncbi:hypothetical protein JCGZ_05664 [Jatropha curcas]|uniref:Tify domain-containing protein n=1 Tax=Jatropha curcas TaxID=180498 RepID=A0A067L703_JATCU|nr:uncharacterized protein LOC105628218 isoform X2 [Jatropha curcas]KDP44197.1 hypothetical protein JCGZ_05664 [Jatropha curcas]